MSNVPKKTQPYSEEPETSLGTAQYGHESQMESPYYGHDTQHGTSEGAGEPCCGETAAVTDKVKQAASTVARKGQEAAQFVGQKAEDATESLGSGLKSLGSTVRERGPHSGMAGSAASAVASSLEHTGQYLQEEGIAGVTEDVTNLIRRNPIPALLIGIGFGYLIAQATTSRRGQ